MSGGSVETIGRGAGRSSQQLGEDRAVHDLFDVAKPAGDVGSVEHAMVVDQLDDDPAGGRVDRAVGQRGRQRRDRVDLLGTERTVAREAEGPKPLAPLVARDVQRAPPEQPPDRRRRLAEPQVPCGRSPLSRATRSCTTPQPAGAGSASDARVRGRCRRRPLLRLDRSVRWPERSSSRGARTAAARGIPAATAARGRAPRRPRRRPS